MSTSPIFTNDFRLCPADARENTPCCRPLDPDEARSFLERHGDAEDVEEYFGDVVEDA